MGKRPLCRMQMKRTDKDEIDIGQSEERERGGTNFKEETMIK